MRKKYKKPLTLAIFTACMLMIAACGKSEEEKAAEEIYNNLDVEEQANVDKDREEIANYDEEAEDTKGDESISAEESVPWDSMSSVNLKDFPVGIRGSVNENDMFFPDILFPSEYTIADGICYASLNNKDYNAYAYVETHARTIADGGGTYFEQVGNFIIYIKDSVKNIEIKDTTHNYLIHISVEIWGADSAFKDEYLLKNCEYIKEQIEEMLSNDASLSEEETTDEDSADVEFVEGAIPYGNYICSENGKYAEINIEDGEFDVIMFGNADTGYTVDQMYDIVWIDGNTYNIELGDKFGTAMIDTNGNIQVMADNDELKPYEGYYTKQE